MNKLADELKAQVDTRGYFDIGTGVEEHMGVSIGEFRNAVSMLKEQGYVVLSVMVNQSSGVDHTIVKLLASPGTTYKDVVVKMK